MTPKTVSLILVSIICFLSVSSAQDSTENKFHVEKADSTLLSDALLDPPKKYSPIKSIVYSALLPGAGQFYCERKSRAAVFLGTELIIGSVALFRYYGEGEYLDTQEKYKTSFSNYYNLLNHFNYQKYKNQNTNSVDSVYSDLRTLYENQFNARTKRKSFRHFIGWGTGIYITNILDALSSSHHFYDDKPRKPGTAAALSAIPCLGLGQIYNGSFQKTGLLLTTQTMLLYMAIDKNILANYCIDKRDEIKAINDSTTLNFSISADHEKFWKDKYNSEIKRRNMYLWYFVLFYFYGIFDAAVDAHLHDKRVKVRLTPLADPVEKEVSMNLSLDLKSRRK